jgi:endonuclease/exonuclease/phosphatase family metal-dependent hydrolase
VVTGDFNAGEQNAAIRQLTVARNGGRPLVDTFRVVHPQAKQVGTFNGFEGRTDGEKIDYVFANSCFEVQSAEIIHTRRESRYPSDHFPVSAQLLLR